MHKQYSIHSNSARIRGITFVAGILISLLVVDVNCGIAEQRNADCTYEMQVWNVNRKSSVMQQNVQRSRSDLLPQETDPATGCSVCSEDQVRIDLPPIAPFPVCYRIAGRVRIVLEDLLGRGAPITSVIGYRVIRSRGSVDKDGNRTEFSNHSFGTAIDINPELNGLYENCVTFGPQCRLMRGGEWRIGVPGTLDRNGDVVLAFKAAGFRWGGEIAGKQKDFMHFSLTGY